MSFDFAYDDALTQLTSDEQNLLAETAVRFVGCSEDEDIYRFIAEQVSRVSGVRLVYVSEYDQTTDSLTCRHLTGVTPYVDKITNLLGQGLVGMRFRITDDDARRLMYTGKLVRIEGGVHALSFGKIPRNVGAAIERLLGITGFYAMGFVRRGQLLGAMIVIEQGDTLNPSFLDVLGSQAGVALHRELAKREGQASPSR